mmetsp:Transcript_62605/g.135920  ORF Transcript_62605/g.135920 Transcript_62605/m.135920 type:complete len:266 (+) Transcript_62605:33-830(+)
MLVGLSSGAHPAATFPCNHLSKPGRQGSSEGLAAAHWAAPQRSRALEELREAIQSEDWESLFAEGKTLLQAEPSWAASPARCAVLKRVCEGVGVRRVLEIGTFCGVASLAMAEALPQGGQVVSLELDPFLLEYGEHFRTRSHAGHRILPVVGPAIESLQRLAVQARTGCLEPFDLVVIDADKTGMWSYIQLLRDSPGLLSGRAVVCVDTTPFKGQPPARYKRFGQADKWVVESGQEEIDALRADVAATMGIAARETDGLLVICRL